MIYRNIRNLKFFLDYDKIKSIYGGLHGVLVSLSFSLIEIEEQDGAEGDEVADADHR